MSDLDDFVSAKRHLEEALALLDRIGERLAAADVSMALERLKLSSFALDAGLSDTLNKEQK